MNRAALIVTVVLLVSITGCGVIDPAPDGAAAGTDETCMDAWSLVHFGSGMLLGERLGPDSFESSLTALAGYEVIERHFWPSFDETTLNQGCDIVVGILGWLAAVFGED